MTHPNFITNGVSLEDCHTNFFALADLCGIKWRRLTIGDNFLSASRDPLEDPVLTSYSKCLAADLLCVWRRVVRSQGSGGSLGGDPGNQSRPGADPHGSGSQQQSSYSKELWIFWYSKEPDLSELVANELQEVEQGSWENGLSYECRTLLFKAFHNLIERCLLSRGFARFGRWFVQPLNSPSLEKRHVSSGEAASSSATASASSYSTRSLNDGGGASTQLTFAFNFFVHGESTVCASVDVRQHPPVYRVNRSHLTAAQGSQGGLNVILSPYGIAGVLTGQTFKENDPSVQRLLNEWKQFYPINQSPKEGQHSRQQQPINIPPPFHVDSTDETPDGGCTSPVGPVANIVELIVAGVKMKYPSCYLFLVNDSSAKSNLKAVPASARNVSNQAPHGSNTLLTPPNTPPDHQQTGVQVKLKTPVFSPRQPQKPSPAFRIQSSVNQEINVCHQQPKPSEPSTVIGTVTGGSEDGPSCPTAHWEFIDPCGKVGCNCYRCKVKKGSNQGSGSNKSGSAANISNSQSSSSNGPNKKLDKSEKDKLMQKNSLKSSAPFHKRNAALDVSTLLELDASPPSVSPSSSPETTTSPSNPSTAGATSNSTNQPTQPKTPSYPYKSPLGMGGLPSLQSNATTPGGTAIDSPRSVAPLLNGDGPASTSNAETSLPSVSPHPQTVKEEPGCHSEQTVAGPSPAPAVSLKEKSHLEQLLSPNQPNPAKASNALSSSDPPSVGAGQWAPGAQATSDAEGGLSSGNTTVPTATTANPVVTNGNCGASESGPHSNQPSRGLKRPALPMGCHDENHYERNGSSLLYDYSSLNSIASTWDLPPPKHRRLFRYRSELAALRKDSSGIETNGIDHLSSKTKDPYEFSEFDEESPAFGQGHEESGRFENSTAIASEEPPADSASRGQQSVLCKDTPSNMSGGGGGDSTSATSPQTPRVFTREEELTVSYRDLDQIFDTSSGEDSNEPTFQAPNAPGKGSASSGHGIVNGSLGSEESSRGCRNGPSGNGCSAAAGILGAVELTRMFPTPPSLEHNAAPSPCNNYLGTDATLIDDMMAKDRTDIYPCSPAALESAKDWSYVYKPPILCKFVASTKYAPLQDIPSGSAFLLPPDCLYKPSSPQFLRTQLLQQQPQQSQSQVHLPSGYQHHAPGPVPGPVQPHGHHPQQQQHHQLMQRHHLLPPSQFASYPPGSGERAGGRMIAPQGQPRASFHSQMHTTGQPQNTQQQSHSSSQFAGYMAGERHLHPGNPIPMYPGGPGEGGPGALPPHPQGYGSYASRNHSNHGGGHPPPNSSVNGHPSSLSTLPYDVQHHEPSYLPGGRHPLPPDTGSPPTGAPEAHSLLINLVLSDSLLNLYKDHNFESCTLCVCNMNIKGTDVGTYLPDILLPGGLDEPQYKCTCGFSAVVNRHRSHLAGLFYEDELEATGVVYDPAEGLTKKSLLANDVGSAAKPQPQPQQSNETDLKEVIGSTNTSSEVDNLNPVLVDLLKTQCSTIFASCSLFAKASVSALMNRAEINVVPKPSQLIISGVKVVSRNYLVQRPDALLRSDGCEVAFLALVSGKQSMDSDRSRQLMPLSQEKLALKASSLHEWPFAAAAIPPNNNEIVGFLRTLQPLLQESVQKKPQAMWEVTYTVSGPLTWRQFHRLAGRGTEDQCEPQPIPSLLVGHDKDWVGLSPFALKYWEKLMLEPYSVTRDVAYIVVSPENSFILPHVKSFFKELSTTYEMLRLGRHCPMLKVLRDGIMRVGKTTSKLADEPVDDWFNQIGDGNVASKLKMYAQTCRHYLVPLLKTQSLDRSLFENQTKPTPEPAAPPPSAAPPSTPGHPKPPGASPMAPDSHSGAGGDVKSAPADEAGESAGQAHSASQPEAEQDDDPTKQPAIVVYVVEPFTFANMDENTYRLSCLGLLRCYAQMLRFLPDHLQNSINLQLVSLDSILRNGKDFWESERQDQLKSLAFSVFSQSRKTSPPTSIAKSLTGFGPAASLDVFLKSRDSASSVSRFYTPPFILAPLKDKQTELGEMFGDRREKSQILFCCYCLTEDQKWLVASCSNEKGDMLETTLINIEVPNRTRRKKAAVRKLGLHKLMEFTLSVMAECMQPWRLVIGRLGRVGHGELREWASLLSKKSLLRYSRLLREKCGQCNILLPYEMPSILSACLISLEADTALRVFPDQFTPDDRFSSSCNTCHLSTPEDASCTHILVFPTSATTQSSQASFQIDPLGPNLGEDDLLQALGADDGDLGVDDGINDLFQWGDSPPPSPGVGSPRPHGLSHPDSPGGRQGGYDGAGGAKSSSGIGGDGQDEPLQLLQQPLALGYYVSTAQTGPLPKWFWSSCSHLKDVSPVFLKSALLIHMPSVQQSNDDLLHSNIRNYHPLDSNLTTDVLRYVLEGYNSLSWLSLDPSTHDRTSCLPVHIQILMQLYYTVQALV